MTFNAKFTAFRGPILHFLDHPGLESSHTSHQYFEDGILLLEEGTIKDLGDAASILARYQDLTIDTQCAKHELLIPGFVDTHVHYPQSHIVGSYGKQLLDWLRDYTFPAERRFSDKQYASEVAEFFFDQLFRNGTTTALAFATVHPESVDAFFEVALQKKARMISGKVMMDRNAPDYLLDTARSSFDDSLRLIQQWHAKSGTRLEYAITPRFAPTSTSEQLTAAGQLKQEYPDLRIQTHMSENRDEILWAKELFPEASGYLDVYDQHGLLSPETSLAHCIHLSEAEWERMADTSTGIACCPTSNLFLGSGLFDFGKAKEFGVSIGLGTDIGAGTSFSMLQTMGEAYKIAQLQQQTLSAMEAFYFATLGGAKMLGLSDRIGTLQTGSEADFTILDLHGTTLLESRMSYAQTLEEKLFALMTLGDDRSIRATYVAGNCVYEKSERRPV